MATLVFASISKRSRRFASVMPVMIARPAASNEFWGVEELLVGLVEADQRRRFQLQAVLVQVLVDRVPDLLDEVGAVLVQVLERHPGGDGAERVHELALDQFHERLRVVGPVAQGLRRHFDRPVLALDAHVKVHGDVGAQVVLGDQGVRLVAPDNQLVGPQADRHDAVEHGQHQ